MEEEPEKEDSKKEILFTIHEEVECVSNFSAKGNSMIIGPRPVSELDSE